MILSYGAGEPDQDHSGQNGFLGDGDASVETSSMNGQLAPLMIDPAVHANFNRCLIPLPLATAGNLIHPAANCVLEIHVECYVTEYIRHSGAGMRLTKGSEPCTDMSFAPRARLRTGT